MFSWYAFVSREDKVHKGQKLGKIRDLFGNVLHVSIMLN